MAIARRPRIILSSIQRGIFSAPGAAFFQIPLTTRLWRAQQAATEALVEISDSR